MTVYGDVAPPDPAAPLQCVMLAAVNSSASAADQALAAFAYSADALRATESTSRATVRFRISPQSPPLAEAARSQFRVRARKSRTVCAPMEKRGAVCTRASSCPPREGHKQTPGHLPRMARPSPFLARKGAPPT